MPSAVEASSTAVTAPPSTAEASSSSSHVQPSSTEETASTTTNETPSSSSRTAPSAVTGSSEMPTSGAAATPASSAESSSSAATKKKQSTKPITKMAKEKLRAYFIRVNWPLNKVLPKGEGFKSGELGNIVTEFGLLKTQVARQLRNFKDEKYGNSQVKILLGADELEEKMRAGLSMETVEFVTLTLKRVHDKDPSSSQDFGNFAKVLDDMPPVAKTLVILWAGNPDNECCTLLTGLVEHWLKNAAEKFPKSAAGLSTAEVGFQKSNMQKKRIFLGEWMQQYEHQCCSSIVREQSSIGRDQFGLLGSFLHNQLFMEWCHSSIDDERPPIAMPDICLVNKWARPVIYYVAGWTLYSASKALTIAEKKRGVYRIFAQAHSQEKDEAKNANLPTSLVEKRKRRSAKIFCTKAYFEFICFVESTYLSNLTLKMMQAYADGDIVHKIKLALLESDVATKKFDELCRYDISLSSDNKQQIMKYLMERYANMRGTFFVKHLKGNCSGNIVDKLAESQATRTKVANSLSSSKAAANAKEKQAGSKEEQLWENAGESAFEYADKIDNSEREEEV